MATSLPPVPHSAASGSHGKISGGQREWARGRFRNAKGPARDPRGFAHGVRERIVARVPHVHFVVEGPAASACVCRHAGPSDCEMRAVRPWRQTDEVAIPVRESGEGRTKGEETQSNGTHLRNAALPRRDASSMQAGTGVQTAARRSDGNPIWAGRTGSRAMQSGSPGACRNCAGMRRMRRVTLHHTIRSVQQNYSTDCRAASMSFAARSTARNERASHVPRRLRPSATSRAMC